jgi:hypothetical protein
MTIMECGVPFADMDGIRGGQSDFKYLSQQLAVTPLLSRRERRPEGVTHHGKVNPNYG